MATYLICSTPVHGHVSPMVAVAAHLSSSGHRVIMLTGSRFEQRVRDAGADFRSLTGNADFDDRGPASYLPDRDRYSGLAKAQYDIQTIFVKTIPAQYREVERIVAAERPDAIIVDGAFGGVAPLLTEDRGARPPVIALGVTPLTQSSRDAAPAGMALPPSSTPLGRLRNRTLHLLARKVLFRDTQRAGERAFAELGRPVLPYFVMDISAAFDSFLQLSTAEFEYPRSDLAPNTSFIGPLPPVPGGARLPEWWADLDGSRPVVHVTQGTIDNHDTTRLIEPAIEALAGEDLLVVVTRGGRAASGRLASAPANVRIAEYLPYDELLPLTDVVVTNGGFGGVQHSLMHGIPLVVAGDTEDKPEVAARVGWSGAGIDLRTGRPRPEKLREAVLDILRGDRFRAAARRQADAISRADPFGSIDRVLLESTKG